MTPLLLLPGMMCDARLFGPQIEALTGTRALHLAEIHKGDTIASIAFDVLAHAPPRFAMAGLSMGGIVAMEIFAQAPERIERLALLDTNPRAEAREVRERREPQMAKVRDGGLDQVMRDEITPLYLSETPDRRTILDLCMSMAMRLGPEVFIRQSRALQSRPDQQDTLRKVACPTLVLCGREDRLCPVERHETMRDLVPGARLSIIDGAGHIPTLEQPDAVNTQLAAWLEA